MKKLALMRFRSSKSRMRREPTRAPYSPWLSLPGRVSASRSGMVSWSQSNDSATATRAWFGHVSGASERPARTCWTCERQVGSSQRHGSAVVLELIIAVHQLRRKRGYADRDVFRAVSVWGAVLDP